MNEFPYSDISIGENGVWTTSQMKYSGQCGRWRWYIRDFTNGKTYRGWGIKSWHKKWEKLRNG